MVNNWLQGKRVLVPRPEAQAVGLVAVLEAQGATALRLPVLTIQPLHQEADKKNKIIDLDHYDDIIVVSRNAAQLGLAAIDQYWPQLPTHLRWFAVGKATAEVLTGFGVNVIVPAKGFNSEALLELPELQELSVQKVLILKGEGGRELLAEQLAKRGAQVDTLPLYRRVAIGYETDYLQALFCDAPDALVATSVEVLKALDDLVSPHLKNHTELPIIVASERIANEAGLLGYQQIITANGAADESIVAALNVIG